MVTRRATEASQAHLTRARSLGTDLGTPPGAKGPFVGSPLGELLIEPPLRGGVEGGLYAGTIGTKSMGSTVVQ